MERNEIYMIQGMKYKQMTIDLLNRINLADEIGDRTKRIGLKPNLVVAKPASSGATTHPELIDGVLSYLKEKGFQNIVVLEGSWVGDYTSEAVRVSGILDVCRKHQVEFIDLQKDSASVRPAAGMEIKVCDEALALDYLINMPVLKGHCQTAITCSLKNCKGLIPNSEKRRFHTLGLHKPIAHLNKAIHQDFILVDNICGDLDFEEGGNPIVMNRIMGFKDPVLCDSYAAESMGYQPYDIEYIRIAEELGVGTSNTSEAKIIDLTPDGHTEKAGKPTRRVQELAGYVAPDNACSACYGSLVYALDRLNDAGELRGKEKRSIGIGQGYRGKTGAIGIGNCTKCFQKNLGGCPPKAVDIARFLRENW